MRIQILELPAEVVGDVVTTSFALVLDRVPNADRLHEHWGEGWSDRLKETSGARAILVFSDEVSVA